MNFNIAQCNISRLREPLDHGSMKEFTDFLEPVNLLADSSEGFVWRLKGEYGQASSNLKPVFDDEKMIINISVWKDVASLKNFTFNTVHQYFLKNRDRWMDKLAGTQFAMWWIPQHQVPTIEEAKEKLKLIEEIGSSSEAFTWKQQFDWEGKPLLI